MTVLQDAFNAIALDLFNAEIALNKAIAIVESKQKDRDYKLKKFIAAGDAVKNSGTQP